MLRRATKIAPVKLAAEFYPALSSRSYSSFSEAVHASPHGATTPKNLLVIAHGLLGSARNWSTVAGKISPLLRQETVIAAVDLRNHGNSAHDDTHSMMAMAVDLDAFVEQVAAESTVSGVSIMGHSMGGAALATALATLSHPTHASLLPTLKSRYPLRAACIVDIIPDARPPSVGELNTILRAMSTITKEDDAGELMTFSKANKLLELGGVSHPGLRQFVLTNFITPTKDSDPTAKLWKCNLPVLHRVVSDGSLFSKRARVGSSSSDDDDDDAVMMSEKHPIDNPTLFIFGEKSPYNDEQGRARLPGYWTREKLRQTVIPGAGHYVHVENMPTFVHNVATFFSSHGF